MNLMGGHHYENIVKLYTVSYYVFGCTIIIALNLQHEGKLWTNVWLTWELEDGI